MRIEHSNGSISQTAADGIEKLVESFKKKPKLLPYFKTWKDGVREGDNAFLRSDQAGYYDQNQLTVAMCRINLKWNEILQNGELYNYGCTLTAAKMLYKSIIEEMELIENMSDMDEELTLRLYRGILHRCADLEPKVKKIIEDLENGNS